jgi:hypothetical protein
MEFGEFFFTHIVARIRIGTQYEVQSSIGIGNCRFSCFHL